MNNEKLMMHMRARSMDQKLQPRTRRSLLINLLLLDLLNRPLLLLLGTYVP